MRTPATVRDLSPPDGKSGAAGMPPVAIWSAPSPLELTALLAFAFVAWFVRAPRILLHGRVLLEEGCTYLRYAWDVPVLRALFAPHQGYYSLLPNLVSVAAARVVPLRYASLLFAWAGVLVQMVVAAVVVTLEVFPTSRARLLALITLLLATPSTQPLFSSICAQFFLAIGTAALLVSDPLRQPRTRVAYLLFAGLNGLTSCALAPLFWVRALLLRSRAAILQAALLSFCALLQAIFVLRSLRHAARIIQPHAWKMLGPVFFQRMLFQPWLSGRVARIYDNYLLGHRSPPYLTAVTLAALLGLIAFLLLAHRAGSAALWLAVAAFWCFFFHWYGALGSDINNLTPFGEDRYWLTGNALLALALLLCARSAAIPAVLRRLSTVLLVFGWLVGLAGYESGWSYLHDYTPWQPQVEAWQHNPSLELRGAPSEWSLHIRLTPQHMDLPLPADTYDSSNPHRRP
jgi:hypothetical protein